MPRKGQINPKTGKRLEWEEEQRRLNGDDVKAIEKQIALLERVQAAQQARDDLIRFVEFTSPHPEDPSNVHRTTYEAAGFHRIIAKHLEEFERGEFTQLIFCMPPRHGKTRLATESLAAWYSGRHPDHDVACAMATDLLATDVGANVRNLMQSPQYKQVFPNHKLIKGGTAKDNIQTTQRGRLVFVGRGGTLNGRGANLLLIDDLYKDDKEAQSQAIRDEAWNWLVRVALRRRMGKKLTVITTTRWHNDDIIGRLTDPENPHYNEEEAKSWKIILLRGIAEDDDVLGRKPGEALWPERFPAEYLLADKRRDPLGFEALTQQRPSILDGDLFKREDIRFYRREQLPADLRIYGASDHAVATGQRNDFTVLMKIGVDSDSNIYVLDVFWQKAKPDAVVEAWLDMCRGDRKPLLWWAERGHISKSIGPFLKKRMQETNNWVNIREVTPVGDKAQRAASIAGRIAMGKLFLPADAPWRERAINQMMAFPSGTHDDFVDTLSLIGLGLQSQFAASNSSGKKKAEAPAFGTLAWVKLADKWRAEQKMLQSAGGF